MRESDARAGAAGQQLRDAPAGRNRPRGEALSLIVVRDAPDIRRASWKDDIESP
jgi:hypothetical protein